MLGEVHQGASVGDQPGADQLAHQHGQVGCDRHHPVLQVLVQLPSVLLDLDNLRLVCQHKEATLRGILPAGKDA